jgi:hypothetical protein
MQYEPIDRCEISISQIAIDLDPFTCNWYSLLVRRQVSKIVRAVLPIYSLKY